MQFLRALSMVVVLLLVALAAYKMGSKTTNAETTNTSITYVPAPEFNQDHRQIKKIGRWLFPCEQADGCECHSGLYPVNHPQIPDASMMRKPIWIEQEIDQPISWQ